MSWQCFHSATCTEMNWLFKDSVLHAGYRGGVQWEDRGSNQTSAVEAYQVTLGQPCYVNATSHSGLLLGGERGKYEGWSNGNVIEFVEQKHDFNLVKQYNKDINWLSSMAWPKVFEISFSFHYFFLFYWILKHHPSTCFHFRSFSP